MVTRVEIAARPELRDPRGARVEHQIRSFLGLPVRRVRTREVYRIDAGLSDAERQRVLHELVDPVLQRGALGRLADEPFDAAITVGYKPGVTDPVGKSARVSIEDTLGSAAGRGRRSLLLASLSAGRCRRPNSGAHRRRAAGQPRDPDRAGSRPRIDGPDPLRICPFRASRGRPRPM